LRRFAHVDFRRCWLRRNSAEVFFDFRQRCLRVDVSDNRDDGIVRCVVGLEESRHVFHAGRTQIGHRANDRVFIGKVFVRKFVNGLERFPVRLIIDAEPSFLLNRVALIVEIVLRDRQGAHPIRFEEQCKVELVSGQGLVVHRSILAGRAVHRPAVHKHQIRMFVLSDVFGSLEHHVFEKVGESRVPLALVARSDVVVDDDGEYRRGMIFRDDDPQTVFEFGIGELNLLQRRGAHTKRHDDANETESLHRASFLKPAEPRRT
jgi:hypothetical protein